MNLVDANVLVYAFRKDGERHDEHRAWLLGLLNRGTAFGMSEQVLSSLVRITTHPRVFRQPSRSEDAIGFADALRGHPSCRLIRPAAGHWEIFTRLCRQADAKGNLVTDAWFAALALESGCTWVTTDRDFARFPGLRWRHPLDHPADIENPA